MNTWIMVSVLGMALAGVAGAQEVKEKPARAARSEQKGAISERPMMDMMKDIGITADQKGQIKALNQASAGEMKLLSAKMQELAVQQARLVNQETPDEAAILKGTEDIGQVRTEIAKVKIRQMLALQKILTPEQRVKMREKMKVSEGKRSDDGMGRGPRHKGAGHKGQEKPQAPSTNAVPVS